MFHTRAGLDAAAAESITEEDEHGNHTVRYSYEVHTDKQVVKRHRVHDIGRYTESRTHDPKAHGRLNVMDDSDVNDITTHEMSHDGEVSSVRVTHSFRMDHGKPSFVDPSETHELKYQLKAQVDATRTMTLVGVTRGVNDEHLSTVGASSSSRARLQGLLEDSPVPVRVDNAAQWREFTDQTVDTLEEALECFERTPKNSTCTVRLNRLIQEDNSTLNHLYGPLHSDLSPIKQQVLIDMIPHIGGTIGQTWLAEVLREAIAVDLSGAADAAKEERVRHRIMRALVVAHQLRAPVAQAVVDVIWELSMAQNSSLSQAGQLALGTISRQLDEDASERVFANLSSRLQGIREGYGRNVTNIEHANTLLRALGNQGDDRLLDLLHGYHTHDCISLRETAAHVLRRIPSPEAEERLLWVLRNDPNHTAQSMAVLSLQHSERNNSEAVVDSIAEMLTTELDLEEALEGRLMKHLRSEAPHMVDGCRMARDDAKRRQLQEDLELAGICVCGACGGCPGSCVSTADDDVVGDADFDACAALTYEQNKNNTMCVAITKSDPDEGDCSDDSYETQPDCTSNGETWVGVAACTYIPRDSRLPPEGEMCRDGSAPIPCSTPADIVTTLVDVYIGKSIEFGAGAGHPDMGIQFDALSKNFARLRISVFGGEFEVNLLTEIGVDVHCFGHKIELIQGVVAFNAGLQYKNTLASQLASMLNTGGKYVKIAMDAERLVQLGMQKGLVYVGEKVEKVAVQVDFVIGKVELVQNVTKAFANADAFVNDTINLIIDKVDPLIEMAAGPVRTLPFFSGGFSVSFFLIFACRLDRIRPWQRSVTGC